MTALEADGLVKTFGRERAVDGVDLTLEAGEFFALIGPSGCGKTTTLRLLAGLSEPDAGTIRLGGEPVTHRPARERATNMVFQDLVLFPHMTVAGNVAYGLERAGTPTEERNRRVAEALSLVDMDGFADRDPDSLSGGQKQRVALARALANDPEVLLLDEPLSSLDRALRQDMQSEFRRIQRDTETTFLYVTHDQASAMSMSDRVAVMREGRVVDVGPPAQLYERPRTRFVAEFLGEATLLEGTVTGTGDRVTVDTPAGEVVAAPNDRRPATGDEATVMVRPESVTVGAGPTTGEVVDCAYKGFYEEAVVELPGGARLSVRQGGDRAGAVRPDGAPQRTGDSPAEREQGRLAVGDSVAVRVDHAVLVGDDGDG